MKSLLINSTSKRSLSTATGPAFQHALLEMHKKLTAKDVVFPSVTVRWKSKAPGLVVVIKCRFDLKEVSTGDDGMLGLEGRVGVGGSCYSCEVVPSVFPERVHDPRIRSELD